MFKTYFAPASLLIIVGVGLIAFFGCREQLPPDQAGVAYIETDDGGLERLDNLRPAERTKIAEHEPATHKPSAHSASGNPGDGTDEEWLTKFVLTERSGESVSSDDLKGQPYVAGFFFTSCPTICPKQNEKVRQLQEKFKGQAVRFLSISCDPEVDRPEVLTAYAERFDADPQQWLFLTGDLNYIRRVGAEFFSLGIVRYVHPEKFVLMDAAGKQYGFYTWSDPNQWQALQSDIEKLIAAGGTIGDEKQATAPK